jgi:hypothetical protein
MDDVSCRHFNIIKICFIILQKAYKLIETTVLWLQICFELEELQAAFVLLFSTQIED